MPRHQSQLRRSLIVTAYVAGIVVLVVLLPASFTSPARVVFTQLVSGVEGVVFDVTGDALSASGTLRDAVIHREKCRLAKKEIRKLDNKNARLREMLLAQRRRLKNQDRLSLQADFFRPVAARVTSYDARSMRKSVVIDAGSRQGLEEGIAVTFDGALVGLVEKTGPWYSRVRLITDPGSQIPCRVQRTRALCILEGTGGGTCSVEWMRREKELKDSDIFVTSPLEGVITQSPKLPAGLPVGSVADVRPGRIQPFFQDVVASPQVDLQRLETVQVLVPEIPAGEGSGQEEEHR